MSGNASMVCWRCRKPFDLYEQYASVQHGLNGRGQARPPQSYHLKCLPPNLFHQPAGSRPARRVATD